MEILYKCKYILFFYLNNTVILYFFKIEIFCKEFIRNYTCNAKNYCRFFYYNQVLLSYSNFQIRYKDWKIDFFDIYTIYTLSLNFKKIRERRIRSLLSAGLNLSHATHIRITYLLLFNLRFYSSRRLSNIRIAQNRRSFTRLSVVRCNKRFFS